MERYQYVLRFPDHDEVRFVDHDGHKVGDRVETDGYEWVVTWIVAMPRWESVHRIVLRPAEDPTADAAAGS